MTLTSPTRRLPGVVRRRVPLLGVCRRCVRCGESWPLDDEFFARNSKRGLSMTCRACQHESGEERRRRNAVAAKSYRKRTRIIIGPLPCESCRASVVVARVSGVLSTRELDLARHRCQS